MKYFDHLKSHLNLARAKTTKNKYRHKTIRTKGLNRQVPMFLENLEDVNEILRVYRAQRAAVKGNWKLVPKDSCEIYRERKKRQDVNERRNRKQDTIDKRNESLVEEQHVKGDKYRQKRGTRNKGNRKTYKKSQKHKKRTQRYSSGSSVSSYTSTSITKSCSSYSDMDLD